MFVERYLELSSELKYRKGEGNAYMQLGELNASKGEFEEGTKNFYRAMKIAEETGDGEQKETAKVNFGVSNGNLKWDVHQNAIMEGMGEKFRRESQYPDDRVEGKVPEEEDEECLDGNECQDYDF